MDDLILNLLNTYKENVITLTHAIASGKISQRAFNPHKILLRSRGSTGVFSSFRYSFMLYIIYKVGPCFTFFHVKYRISLNKVRGH